MFYNEWMGWFATEKSVRTGFPSLGQICLRVLAGALLAAMSSLGIPFAFGAVLGPTVTPEEDSIHGFGPWTDALDCPRMFER